MKSENSVAIATVIPNWRKNCPVMPPMNAIGTKTTTSTSVIVIAARPISVRPLRAASLGSSRSRRCR